MAGPADFVKAQVGPFAPALLDQRIAQQAQVFDHLPRSVAFLRAGIDVCSTAMTPWVWPTMHLSPPQWIQPITEACELGESSCFTTGIDPGFANDLFPMTLMGLCGEVRTVRALEILDYVNYEGDYENEMGIGKPPEFHALLEYPEILIMSWGATVPMMAHAVGIEAKERTHGLAPISSPIFPVKQAVVEHDVFIIILCDFRARRCDIIKSLNHV